VDTGDRLLTPGEVAALFRVDPKTVTRWAAAGRIGSIRTPGGHRRFRESEVRTLLEGEGMLDEAEGTSTKPGTTTPETGSTTSGTPGGGNPPTSAFGGGPTHHGEPGGVGL
jgi:excisionase family DNA binding protein